MRSFNSKIKPNATYKISLNLKPRKKWEKIKAFTRKILRKKNKINHPYLNYLVFKKTFKKMAPCVIIAISPPRELCLASRSEKAQVIEIAHGFGNPPTCPVHGREARSKIKPINEPNLFVCFDPQQYRTRKAGDANRGCSTIIAKKLFHNQKSIEKNDWKKKETILITLQWGYNGEIDYLKGIIKDGILHPILKKIISEDCTKNWLLKFHPVQVRIPEKWETCKSYIQKYLKTKNNKVYDVTFEPIDFVLRKCGLHMTMMSGSAYEAAFLGVPTLAFCPSLQKGQPNSEYYKDLETAGLLQKATFDNVDLPSLISTTLQNSYTPFPTGADQHLGEVIYDLIHRQP